MKRRQVSDEFLCFHQDCGLKIRDILGENACEVQWYCRMSEAGLYGINIHDGNQGNEITFQAKNPSAVMDFLGVCLVEICERFGIFRAQQ